MFFVYLQRLTNTNLIMEVLIAFLSIIWSILCLILFFKIWGATNDIAEMKDLLRTLTYNSPQANTPNVRQQDNSIQQSSANDIADAHTPKMEDLELKKGDYIIRNIDNKEYKIEEVRPNGVLIYLGMMGGYRTLNPEEFTIIKK